MARPLLSIIVPAYNCENLISVCINSLINQTLARELYEIIIVDDKSTDNTLLEIAKYGVYKNIKIIKNPINLRQGGARNNGLKNSSGKYIMFVDADDWVDANYCKYMLDKIQSENYDIVICNYYDIKSRNSNEKKLATNLPFYDIKKIDNKIKELLWIYGGLVWNKIYRRDFLLKIDSKLNIFPENMYYEDNAILNHLLCQISSIGFVKQPLYFYYKNQNSTVHNTNISKLLDRKKSGEILIRLAKNSDYIDSIYDAVEYRVFMLYYLGSIKMFFGQKPKNETMKIFHEIKNHFLENFPTFNENKFINEMVNKNDIQLIMMHINDDKKFSKKYTKIYIKRLIKSWMAMK